VAGFLYGSAIWPVYLTTRFGAGIVQSILEEEGKAGAATLDATDTVLLAAGSSLAAEYTRFAAWNAATGARAPAGAGYANAAKYPLMKTTELTDGAHGATSGLASVYYHVAMTPDARAVSVTADAKRTTVTLVPIEGGAARVDKATPLGGAPTRVEGEAIAIVSGITSAKTDANYTLSWTTAGAQGPSAHGGCSVGVAQEKPSSASIGGVLALTGLTAIGALLRRLKARARNRPSEMA
jgi:MYXO-CTERM domain-containing protein